MTDQGIYINSQELYQEVKKLVKKGHRNILITAPIETGKTNFIYENLLYDQDVNSVVMLSNRALLKEQTRQELNIRRGLDIGGDNRAYCYQLIGNVLSEDNDRIKFFNEQFKKDNELTDEELEEIYKQIEQFVKVDIKEVDCLILDEAHYFTSDSVFNKKTAEEFEYLHKECKGVKLYMTATPEAFVDAIKIYEKRNNIKGKDRLIILEQLKQVTESDLEDFEYITADEEATDLLRHIKEHYEFRFIHEADREAFLREQVKISNPNNKMIYFTTNKIRGYGIAQQAEGMTYRDNTAKGGAFICTLYDGNFKDTISMEERERIIQRGRFNTDVLVTTAVLDNGVNIHDKNVKRVIIDYVDVGEVVQMLGRVRTKSRAIDNKLKIVIILPTLEKINNEQRSLQGKLEKSKSIFEKEQIKFKDRCYGELKDVGWLNDIRIENDEDVLYDPPEVPTYFAHLYYLLVNYDLYYLLKYNASEFHIEPKGLYRVRELYLEEKERKIQEQKEKAERKEREQQQREMKKIATIQACFAKYGNRELLKDEFDVLAKDLNFKNKDSKLLKTATKINEQLIEYGYKIEKNVSSRGETRNKTIYKFVKKP